MSYTVFTTGPGPCQWCGNYHGPHCPIIKAIEYFPNGMIKRVEYVDTGPTHDRNNNLTYWPR